MINNYFFSMVLFLTFCSCFSMQHEGLRHRNTNINSAHEISIDIPDFNTNNVQFFEQTQEQPLLYKPNFLQAFKEKHPVISCCSMTIFYGITMIALIYAYLHYGIIKRFSE